MSIEENKAPTRHLFVEDLNEGDLLSRSKVAGATMMIWACCNNSALFPRWGS